MLQLHFCLLQYWSFKCRHFRLIVDWLLIFSVQSTMKVISRQVDSPSCLESVFNSKSCQCRICMFKFTPPFCLWICVTREEKCSRDDPYPYTSKVPRGSLAQQSLLHWEQQYQCPAELVAWLQVLNVIEDNLQSPAWCTHSSMLLSRLLSSSFFCCFSYRLEGMHFDSPSSSSSSSIP